ncbi:MAG: hypothetical protein ACK4E0_15250 [Chitinophagaceae bacterium]
MKCILTVAVCLFSYSVLAQKSSVFWGDEFKLKRGSTDLRVVYADKSGVYLQEGHLALNTYFFVGATVRSSATLIKLDKNLHELYRNDFNGELKGKDYSQFFVIQDRLYLFATVEQRKDRSMQVYACELDKNTGALMGDWRKLASFTAEGSTDQMSFKLTLNADSTRMIMVSAIKGREKNAYIIQDFDANMDPGSPPVTIKNEFDNDTYQLHEVLYTVERKILLVAGIYEYREGKKKKTKFLDFANFNIRLYDKTGKFQKEVNTEIDGRWLITMALSQQINKDLILAAFYSNEKRGKSVDGMLVQRINSLTGEVLNTAMKEINYSQLTGNESVGLGNLEEVESKEERMEREKMEKSRDEGEAFSNYLRFRSIYFTEDKGLVIIAENLRHFNYTSERYNPGNSRRPDQWSYTHYSVYECGDILVCKMDENGSIDWMRALPKSQREVIVLGSGTGMSSGGFYDPADGPYHAGFTSLANKNEVRILFNDSPDNASVTQPGQKAKLVSRFGKSECFLVTINLATGNIEKESLFPNAPIPTSMPRSSTAFGNELYMIGKDDRPMARSKIAVARIVID